MRHFLVVVTLTAASFMLLVPLVRANCTISRTDLARINESATGGTPTYWGSRNQGCRTVRPQWGDQDGLVVDVQVDPQSGQITDYQFRFERQQQRRRLFNFGRQRQR